MQSTATWTNPRCAPSLAQKKPIIPLDNGVYHKWHTDRQSAPLTCDNRNSMKWENQHRFPDFKNYLLWWSLEERASIICSTKKKKNLPHVISDRIKTCSAHSDWNLFCSHCSVNHAHYPSATTTGLKKTCTVYFVYDFIFRLTKEEKKQKKMAY